MREIIIYLLLGVGISSLTAVAVSSVLAEDEQLGVVVTEILICCGAAIACGYSRH